MVYAKFNGVYKVRDCWLTAYANYVIMKCFKVRDSDVKMHDCEVTVNDLKSVCMSF